MNACAAPSRGGSHDDQLVATDPDMPVGNGSNDRCAQVERTFPRIQHDEVVAEPVHLEKRRA